MKSFLPLLLILPVLCLAEPATVIRAVELKKDPATDAPTVAPLAENARVDALERKGGWTRVKTDAGAEGWVKMLVLRYSAAAEAKQGDGGVAQLVNIARTGTTGTQVTTGVRGLDAEQLANARPNPAELARLQAYAAAKDGAAAFASQGPLQAQRVAYPAGEGR